MSTTDSNPTAIATPPTYTWRDIPAGYYAVEVLVWADAAEEDTKSLGWAVYRRQEARTAKTGRVTGKNRWMGPRVWLNPGVTGQDWLHATENDSFVGFDPFSPDGREFIIEMLAMYPRCRQDAQQDFAGITGRCACCRRPITDKDSILHGLGPECGGRRKTKQ